MLPSSLLEEEQHTRRKVRVQTRKSTDAAARETPPNLALGYTSVHTYRSKAVNPQAQERRKSRESFRKSQINDHKSLRVRTTNHRVESGDTDRGSATQVESNRR